MVGGIVRELKRAAPGNQANEELQVSARMRDECDGPAVRGQSRELLHASRIRKPMHAQRARR